MARNRCLAMLSLEGATGELELDGLDGRVASDAALRRVAAAVGALPADQCAALLLAEIGVHAEEEIATIIGAPRDKVSTLVGLAGIAAVLVAFGVVAAGHGQGAATPGALAPVGTGRAGAAGSGGSAGATGATGDAGAIQDADLRDEDGVGPLTRAAAEAQRILD